MCTVDELIEGVIRASHVPSATRRAEIERELRAHFEDFLIAARNAGRSDEEIQTLLAAHFGDPSEVARQFAWVYRRERAARRLSAFVLSTIAVAAIVGTVLMAAQAGLAVGLRVPLARMFNRWHTIGEGLDIAGTVTTYVGLNCLEKLFETRRRLKSTALVGAVFAVLIAIFVIAGLRSQFFIFGFVSGVFLRSIQLHLKRSTTQFGVVLICFGIAGLLSRSASVLSAASWTMSGAAYYLMTRLATRVHRVLSEELI